MVIGTRQATPSKAYERTYVYKRGKGYPYIDWQFLFLGKFNFPNSFVIELKAKTNLDLSDIRKYAEQEVREEIYRYWRACVLIQKSPTWQLKTHVPIQPITIDIVYNNRELIEGLLGNQGKSVLEKVVNLIQDTVQENSWPLNEVEVHHITDLEVKDWRYVLLELLFNSDFDSADKYLHDFYEKLDTLTDTLNDEEQEILRGMLFFDVGTTVLDA